MSNLAKLQKVSQVNDMDRDEIFKTAEQCMSASTVAEVWDVLLAFVQRTGFCHVLYGFTKFHTDYGFGDDSDHLLLTNFDKPYVDGYFVEGRYRNGPMVKWALDNVGTRSWGWMAEEYENFTDAERETLNFNLSRGVTAGYTIGFQHSLKRAKGAIGMSLEPFKGTQEQADAIWAVHGRDIEFVCGVAHLKIISLPLPKRLLTSRQREVLEWVADGKTVVDTAQIMGLNRATVEKHLRLAREALGVETTAQAVLKASFHNQIYVI